QGLLRGNITPAYGADRHARTFTGNLLPGIVACRGWLLNEGPGTEYRLGRTLNPLPWLLFLALRDRQLVAAGRRAASAIVTVDDDGVLAWAGQIPLLEACLRHCFVSRGAGDFLLVRAQDFEVGDQSAARPAHDNVYRVGGLRIERPRVLPFGIGQCTLDRRTDLHLARAGLKGRAVLARPLKHHR